LTELVFGPNLPIVHEVQLLYIKPWGETALDASISYVGGFHVVIEVVIDMKVPALGNVTVPASLSVTVKSLSGKVHFLTHGPPSDRFWLGFYEEPKVELAIDTRIGSKHPLHNLPKLPDIIVYKLKKELIKMMVLPEMDDWPLPKIKPSGGNEVQEGLVEFAENPLQSKVNEKSEVDKPVLLRRASTDKIAEIQSGSPPNANQFVKPGNNKPIIITPNKEIQDQTSPQKPEAWRRSVSANNIPTDQRDAFNTIKITGLSAILTDNKNNSDRVDPLT